MSLYIRNVAFSFKKVPRPTRAPAPPDGAESYQWLPTGRDGLEAMLAEIENARKSILLEMYIFTAEPVGQRFLEALLRARQRGVRTRILLDALGSISLPGSFWHPLVQSGGEFRWFNPFQISKRYGYRNHRKLLVVDGEVAVIGGFNIAEAYNGDGVTQGWRDLGMRFKGAIALALAQSFEELYNQAGTQPPRFPSLRGGPDIEVQDTHWNLLLAGPGRGHNAFRRSLLGDLSQARRVQIICGYFVPTWRLRRALKKVAKRGGSVELILAGKSDVRTCQLASRHLYTKLMAAGVTIFEYQPQILHTKLFIIDDILYIGSANLDARSLKINYELLVRIHSSPIAREGRALFAADLAHSLPIDPAGWKTARGFLERLLERLAYLLLARIDPYITSLRWKKRAEEAIEKTEGLNL